MMLTKTKPKVWNRADFIQKWIKALKSGKYKQANGVLKNNNSYCCLGLACSLASQDYNFGEFQGNAFECASGERETMVLPEEIRSKLRTADEGCVGITRKSGIKLSTLNDSGINFKGIAAILEAYPLVLEDGGRKELSLSKSFSTKDEVVENLNLIFRKTKYAKNYKQFCVTKGSNIAKLLK